MRYLMSLAVGCVVLCPLARAATSDQQIIAVQQAQIVQLAQQQKQLLQQQKDQQVRFSQQIEELKQSLASSADPSRLDGRYCRRAYAAVDLGYADDYRGWYEVDGCLTYCRWVGNGGSGGDPKTETSHGSSFWACASGQEYVSYQSQSFNYRMVAKAL